MALASLWVSWQRIVYISWAWRSSSSSSSSCEAAAVAQLSSFHRSAERSEWISYLSHSGWQVKVQNDELNGWYVVCLRGITCSLIEYIKNDMFKYHWECYTWTVSVNILQLKCLRFSLSLSSAEHINLLQIIVTLKNFVELFGTAYLKTTGKNLPMGPVRLVYSPGDEDWWSFWMLFPMLVSISLLRWSISSEAAVNSSNYVL